MELCFNFISDYQQTFSHERLSFCPKGGTQYMNTKKRFYWLKLKEDFFQDTVIKYLRSLPEGSTLVIIYLKLQCIGLKNEGFIKHTGLFPIIEEEIALAIDEKPDLVKITIRALLQAKNEKH